jgi:hypothetical protein
VEEGMICVGLPRTLRDGHRPLHDRVAAWDSGPGGSVSLVAS